MGRGFINLTRVTLQNVTNLIYFGNTGETRLETVVHRPLGSNPLQFIEFRGNTEWTPGEPLPASTFQGEYWQKQRGSAHSLINWQGTGQDYKLFFPGQLASKACWPADTSLGGRQWLAPEAGLTMGECWVRYGLAYQGEAVDDAVAVTLDGVAGAVARPGLALTLGAPGFVMTIPNPLNTVAPAKSVTMYFMRTGRLDGINVDRARVHVNDGPVEELTRRDSPVDAEFRHSIPALTPGWRVVKSWAVDAAGQILAHTERVGCFEVAGSTEPKPAVCVGGSTPPPPPPVDCVVSEWSDWSAWTFTALTTQERTRTRTVVTEAANGGAACPDLSETETRTGQATAGSFVDFDGETWFCPADGSPCFVVRKE
jgi:hypothetical protein